MKKILAALMLMVFVVGCAGVSVQAPNTNSVQAAGNAIGILVSAKYPAIAAQTLPYAKVFLASAQAGKIDSATVATAVNQLLSQCGDDIEIKTAVNVGMAFVNVQITTGTPNPELIALLTGFVQGITPAAS
jgi:PBP1b-binding outer membrane lipoprotein LpoB